MVEDLGYRKERLGVYTGILAASFCSAQFLSSLPWSWVSDKYGRKAALISGLLGSAVGMAIFGTSTTYAQGISSASVVLYCLRSHPSQHPRNTFIHSSAAVAVTGRIVGGLLTGNLPVIKSFVQEITDDTNRGQGFGILTMSWSVGSVLAALAGGALSHPVDEYPSLFARQTEEGSISIIFGAYPYLLPCLFVVSFNVLSALWCAAFMNETLHRRSQESFQGDVQQYYQAVCDVDSDSAASDRDELIEIEMSTAAAVAGPINRAYGTATEAAVSSGRSGSILVDATMILVSVNYATLCAASIILAETLPLFLKAAVGDGGYSLSSLRIGQVLAAASIGSVALSSLLLPFISGWSNGLMLQASTLLSALMVVGFPIISSINSAYVATIASSVVRNVVQWSLLLVPLVLELQCEILAFTAILMQVNASAPKEQLAQVNALAQSLGSLSRAAAPALGGLLWSVGFSYHFIYVNFIVCALLYVCCCFVNRALPSHLTRLLS